MALEIRKMHGEAINGSPNYLLALRSEGRLMLDAPFQRGSVWTDDQRRAWIETMIDDLPRPPLFINDPVTFGPFNDRAVVIDGKQRIEAIFAFLDDQLDVRGERYSDQDDGFRRRFKTWALPIVITRFDRERECVELYVRLLRCGTAHTEEEIQHAEQLLDNQWRSV